MESFESQSLSEVEEDQGTNGGIWNMEVESSMDDADLSDASDL
jgi:hypothetical protein